MPIRSNLAELVAVTGHHRQVLDDAGLIGDDLNVGESLLAGEPDVHGLATAQVAYLAELRAHEQRSIVAGEPSSPAIGRAGSVL